MKRLRGTVRTEGIADLAFALVVLAAYFTTFSNVHNISASWMILVISLGIVYIAIGVYGFAYVSAANSVPLRILYFGGQIFLGNIILYLSGVTGFNAMILLPLTGHSAVILKEYWRYTMNGAMASTYAIALRLFTGSWEAVLTNLPLFLAAQVFILVFTQMAVAEEKARREALQMAENLSEANQQLRKYAVKNEELAMEKERNRVAREIHDGIGHHLTALNMQLKAARAVMKVDPVRSGDLLHNAEEISQQALVDIRHSVAALREGSEQTEDLCGSIQKILQGAESTGMNVTFETRGEPRVLAPETSLTLFRVVQESISNTLKHAKASTYQVDLDFTNQRLVRLAIRDDGVGTDNHAGGFGLVGMRERVNLLDGSIFFRTSKGQGFEIDITLPG